MERLDAAAVSYQVVLTKADKAKPPELERRIVTLGAELAGHAAAHPDIITTSAHAGAGIPELRAALAALAAPGQFD
jgi:GTP-binding protein